MSSKTFANNTIRLSRAYGLNNTDTAYVLQTSRRTLGRIRQANPSYTPSEETLVNIADAFGVAPTQVTKRLSQAVIASVL